MKLGVLSADVFDNVKQRLRFCGLAYHGDRTGLLGAWRNVATGHYHDRNIGQPRGPGSLGKEAPAILFRHY